ncbi:hypothetical protein CPB84DRAFT_1785569 [Gymnopilus junonius]|uniref:Transmembrane protein n=1 Tax=Gymnopilus junonius TaxID=109634 RepID=A0A9P5NIY3_GYMJU|nr:hypothetical protein CPB84DRAFT_1785569 [Gymnopilus junonius]
MVARSCVTSWKRQLVIPQSVRQGGRGGHWKWPLREAHVPIPRRLLRNRSTCHLRHRMAVAIVVAFHFGVLMPVVVVVIGVVGVIVVVVVVVVVAGVAVVVAVVVVGHYDGIGYVEESEVMRRRWMVCGSKW